MITIKYIHTEKYSTAEKRNFCIKIESFHTSHCKALRRQAGLIKLIATARPTAQFCIEIVQL